MGKTMDTVKRRARNLAGIVWAAATIATPVACWYAVEKVEPGPTFHQLEQHPLVKDFRVLDNAIAQYDSHEMQFQKTAAREALVTQYEQVLETSTKQEGFVVQRYLDAKSTHDHRKSWALGIGIIGTVALATGGVALYANNKFS